MRRISTFRLSILIFGVVFFSSAIALASPDKAKVKAMSRNLYIGADIFKVVDAATDPDAGPMAVPMAVAEVYNTIQYTDFKARAEAIADEIRRYKPHLIGLQEVSRILTQIPGDFISGNPEDASDVVYDYLDILMSALSSRNLKYEVAVIVTNADVELPIFAGFSSEGYPILNDVRLIDHDVILVRKDVKYWNEYAQNYSMNISLEISGADIEFTRGFVAIDAEVDGIVYRFINTHLEVGGGPGYVFSAVQAAQMNELLSYLAYEQKPVILVGDLNSDPEDTVISSDDYGSIFPPYMQAVGAGYEDIWNLQKKPAKMTCCYGETIDDPEDFLIERIDHIFLNPNDILKSKQAKVRATGIRMYEMTASGLWPSDHAGVFGRIMFYRMN